jgi:hypothetical protein
MSIFYLKIELKKYFDKIKGGGPYIFFVRFWLRQKLVRPGFVKFQFIDSFTVSLGIEIEMHKKCIFITFLL